MTLEGDIQAALSGGDLRKAAELAVTGYGPEVLGFLAAYLRDEEDAREVFAQTCADLWVGLGAFRGEASFRTWFYSLARHAAARLRRSPFRQPGRRAPASEAHELAERVRSQTLPHLRTAAKDELAAIRESLDPEDRALLVLRIDRAMSWSEVADVMATETKTSSTDRARLEARLRKRFQLLKDDIRERCLRAGLSADRET